MMAWPIRADDEAGRVSVVAANLPYRGRSENRRARDKSLRGDVSGRCRPEWELAHKTAPAAT